MSESSFDNKRYSIFRGHLPLEDEAPGWMRIGGNSRDGSNRSVPVFPLNTMIDSSEVYTDDWGTHGESIVVFDGIAEIDNTNVLVSGAFCRSGQRIGVLDVVGNIQ